MKNSILLVALLLVGVFTVPAHVEATGLSQAIELEGYAWSATTGWVSMNCDQTGTGGPKTCGTSNYKVQIETDGRIAGHAWSSTIGWIRFSGLSSFPSGSGTQSANAQANGTVSSGLTFTGWARACSATVGGNCSSMTTNTNAGGWDGWISLQGTATNGAAYGITMTGGVANAGSFAWGSAINVGWVSFAPIVGGTVTPVRLKNNTDIIILGVATNASVPDVTGYVTMSPQANVEGIPLG